jgi:RNA polymerase sigma factor (sigma-70 family)
MENDKHSWPDDQLLRAANQGDLDAFRVFCGRSIVGLLRYCKRLCRDYNLPLDPDLPTEFAQDAILKALKYVQNCRNKRRRFPQVSVAWINGIARNRIIDWIRKRRRLELADDGAIHNIDGGSMTPEQLELKREQQEQALSCLNLLGMRQREILELVYINDMSIQEAGSKMGLSRAAAYKLHGRSLFKMRELFRLHGSEPEAASIPS